METADKKKRPVIISEVSRTTPENGKFPFVMMNFSQAQCNVNSFMKSDSSLDLEVKGWQKGRPSFDLQVDTPHLSYVNTDYEDKYYTTYVAIRDKTTGKTRLFESMDVLLKPKVEPPPSTNPVLLKPEDEQDREEMKKTLVKAFGQSKGKRYYDQKDQFEVNAEDTVARVQKAVADVDVDTMAKREIAVVNIVPPRDETANRADMFYRVEHFLEENEMQQMIEACTEVLQEYNSVEAIEKGIESKEFSHLGAYFLKKLLDQAVLPDAKAALVLYLDSIIKFSRLRPHEIAKGHKHLPSYLPKSMKSRLLREFSADKIVTQELRDKAICYTIVLSLILNNFSLEISLLSESMKVKHRHLKQLVMMIGAHVEVDAASSQPKIVLKNSLTNFNVNYVAKRRN